jgi:hypothetical protein
VGFSRTSSRQSVAVHGGLADGFPMSCDNVVTPSVFWVAQSCRQVGFADEPLQEGSITGELRAQNLQCLSAGQPGMLDKVAVAESRRDLRLLSLTSVAFKFILLLAIISCSTGF